ncbi:MAG: hypothetical protein KJ947_02840 [Alphaproteobacteria bacterium]|nr:hypothetical protein [Alphaproteobacteria bacterium]MBU1548498.1 hypothetical protein [Alphaproteobacteria bacterium]MBU2337694.1 hypothetical protein [Alphaproteobacteria bacterium]MBU2389831.1 hypothetical protein [Alphaproteobacteria bacterium]
MLERRSLKQKIGASPIIRRGFSGVVSMAGPVAVAGAHFLASALLIPHVDPAEFGTFAFAMVVLQVFTGISDGLLGSPMAVTAHNAGSNNLNVFWSVNIIYCTFVFLISLVIFLGFTGATGASFLAVFVATMTFRWFCRALLIQQDKKKHVWLADILYSCLLVGLLALVWVFEIITIEIVTLSLCAAAMITLPLFLWALRGVLRIQPMLAASKAFRPIWIEHSRWSLLGVGANAITIESHVFVVSLIAGPAAFAPVAVAALLYRPTLIGIYSIAQVERPRIAKIAHESGVEKGARETGIFIIVLCVMWFANSVGASILISFFGEALSDKYDLSVVTECAALLGAVMLVRSIRHPLLTFLQAVHRFKAVATMTGFVAPISVVATISGLYVGGVTGSIAGLLFSDIALLVAVYTQFRTYSRSADALKSRGPL